MRYRVWDEEDKKERTLSNCVTDLGEIGTVKRVNIRTGKKLEVHHFKVLEVLTDGEKF